MKNLFCGMLFLGMQVFAQNIGIEPFASGLDHRVELAHANDSRLFACEKAGKIKIINSDGTVESEDFLNITPLVLNTGEAGLLGLAFHPQYQDNGYFYVFYAQASDGAAVIARYSVSDDPNVADPDSQHIFLMVEHPANIHYGGCLRFGPDGLLYIAMGDGGNFMVNNSAQDKESHLGKILRLDVDAAAPYIPEGNPFVGTDGLDEIWAMGLRNPWKISFDKTTGELWISDVGEGAFEEFTKISQPLQNNLNFGWPCYEGNVALFGTCTPEEMTFPAGVYPHSEGCSIIGGFVYRGSNFPAFAGKYFFADFCSAKIGVYDETNGIQFSEVLSDQWSFLTMGEDVNGELYAGGLTTIYKIVDTDLGVNDTESNKFIVSPNPAGNTLSIKSALPFQGKLQLYDLSGKTLLENYIQIDSESIIDLTAVQSGMYILALTDDSGGQSKLKIAKY